VNAGPVTLPRSLKRMAPGTRLTANRDQCEVQREMVTTTFDSL
jgi:hypothetical protein